MTLNMQGEDGWFSVEKNISADFMKLSDQVGDILREAVSLSHVISASHDLQWTGNEHDTVCLHSDPTGNVASDPVRLRVRAKTIEAERALEHARKTLVAARVNLEKVLDA